jgi:hypothetical protein
MKRALKPITAALFLAFAAACVPQQDMAYAEAPRPAAQPLAYPPVAAGAAGGQVYEYH